MKNTKKQGSIRFVVFQEPTGEYCGVCLDFDLIEWGDDKDAVLLSIQEAAESYLQGVVDHDLPDEMLNRPAPNKYWQLLKKSTDRVLAVSREKASFDSAPSYFGFQSQPYHDSIILA